MCLSTKKICLLNKIVNCKFYATTMTEGDAKLSAKVKFLCTDKIQKWEKLSKKNIL